MIGYPLRRLAVENSGQDQRKDEQGQRQDDKRPAETDLLFDIATCLRAVDTLDYQLSGSGVKS